MNKKLIPTDFYDAINGEWSKKTKIPEHLSGTGSFYKIDDNIKKIKSKLLNLWQKDDTDIKSNPTLIEMNKFFAIIKNWNARKTKNLKSLQKYLDEINNLQSWKDIEKQYKNFQYLNYFLPFSFFIMNDFKDSTNQILWLEYPKTILPDKDYYNDETKKKTFIEVWKNMALKIFKKLGIKKSISEKHINNSIVFDETLSKYILSSEELSVYTNLYNIYTVETLNEKSEIINIKNVADSITNNSVDKISVISNEFINNIKNIYNNETFHLFKSRMFVDFILSSTSYLNNNTRQIATEYPRFLTGAKKPLSKSKFEIELAMEFFGMPFGLYYGKTYFGEKAKKNVEDMVKNMVQIYKNRLAQNTWLSKETKEKAINKLNKLGIHIAYPNKIRPYYDDFIVKEYEGYNDLLENVMSFTYKVSEWKFNQYNQKVNKELWSMSPTTVNAYYSPSENHIVFPAAILQKPFYDINQSSSANYGGIGSVIAHEISHAFDNNGANFDENGNMVNWWTEQDKKNFDLKTEAMINLFNNVETEFGKCNGKLTVSENIADAGGLSCALEAAKLEKDLNLKKFYINFATIWRVKRHEEISKLLLQTDVHAPAKLRANIQVKNSDDFYKAFRIKKDDKMYLSPEKRVKIW